MSNKRDDEKIITVTPQEPAFTLVASWRDISIRATMREGTDFKGVRYTWEFPPCPFSRDTDPQRWRDFFELCLDAVRTAAPILRSHGWYFDADGMVWRPSREEHRL